MDYTEFKKSAQEHLPQWSRKINPDIDNGEDSDQYSTVEPWLENRPDSFKVIGCGALTFPTIKQIEQLGYDGLNAFVTNDPATMAPSDDDMMAIILAPDINPDIESLLKTFYQAGVLTLLVTTPGQHIDYRICDSHTVIEPQQAFETVKALIDPIFLTGQIAVSLKDLTTTLRDSGWFHTLEVLTTGADNRILAAIEKIAHDITPASDRIHNLILTIAFNKALEPPIMIKELTPLIDYTKALPQDTEIIWGIYHDNSLPCDTIRMSVITAGK